MPKLALIVEVRETGQYRPVSRAYESKKARQELSNTLEVENMSVLLIPTPTGLTEITIRDSRQATQLAEYWNAVQRYLQTGDESELRRFKGKHIKDAKGRSMPLLTDTQELDRLGNAGVLSFESLYVRVR
ncbi:MAG TPA: hypothetical protein VIB39_20250 [Candidatus Angelobacter sp.]|jgi:hypothetical protein